MAASIDTTFGFPSWEGSVKHLFKFFCNNLYLGQFELARACVTKLHTEAATLENPVLKVLSDIVEHPYNRCLESGSVSSPVLLSWMCHQERIRLEQRSSEKDPVGKKIEFYFLLFATSATTTDDILKELYIYHCWINSEASVDQKQPLLLSSALLKFLCKCLLQSPSLGHALIQTLIPPDSQSVVKNSKALHMVYITALNGLLDKLLQDDLGEKLKQESSSKLKEILSFVDPKTDLSKLPLRQLFFKILECCQQDAEYIDRQVVLSLLFGQTQILEEFCRIDYEAETNNAVASYQSCANLTEEQRCLLHLSSLPDYNTRLQMFLLLSIKNRRHFMEAIVETSISLIQSGMFDELGKLLSHADLQPVKPLLLLLGWTHCCTITEAKHLLVTLGENQDTCQHPAIRAGCNKLSYQIELIQWCIDKTKPMVTETGTPKQLQAADMFKRLENHSILYVLHHSTKLSALDFREVLELLQKRPPQKEESLEGESEDKKKKSVRFVDDETREDVSLSQESVLSLDQRKDISIYIGYCVLQMVMETIMFCCNSSDERLSRPVKHSRKHRQLRVSSGSGSDLESSARIEGSCKMAESDQTQTMESQSNVLKVAKGGKTDLQQLYYDKVTKKLKSVKDFLAKLQPLTFRAEILENVFSLLFVTHEDLQESLLPSEYNSEDEPFDVDRSRQPSSDIGTPGSSPFKGNSFKEVLTPSIEVTETSRNIFAYDEPFVDVASRKKDSNKDDNIDLSQVGKRLEHVQSKLSASREKLNLDVLSDGHRSSFSENLSSYSTASSNGLGHFGFMVNEYLARDILALLKDCLVDLQAAKFHVHGKTSDKERSDRQLKTKQKQEVKQTGDIDTSIEKPLCLLVKSSITMETLQKTMTQLSQFVSEAQWRFQLVSQDQVPKQAGEILLEPVDTGKESSEDEVELITRSHKSSRKRRLTGRRSPRPEREHHEGHSEVSEGAEEHHQRSRVKSYGSGRNHGIVLRMLSSPITLLNMSIRNGKFTETKQIIKLCKLEDQPESVEVWFSQAYLKACKSVQGMTGTSSATPKISAGTQMSIKSIASVAAAGIASVSISNVAEELLNFPALPPVPTIPEGLQTTLPQTLLSNFCAENNPVIILLDLLVSSGRTWEVCNHLMELIKTRATKNLKSTETSKSEELRYGQRKTKEHKIRDLGSFLSRIEGLLSLGVEEQFLRTEQTELSKLFHFSIQQFLCRGENPLSKDKCREYALLCQNISKTVDSVEEAFSTAHSSVQKSDSLGNSPRQRIDSTGSVSSLRSTKRDKTSPHHCMKQLIQVLEKDVPPGGVISLINRSAGDGPTRKNRVYLQSLYEHCKQLAHLVAESEAASKEEMIVPRDYFTILGEGPIRILGRMMFNKQMQPERLTKVAEALSLNLTHIIVYSCCQKIPSKRLPALSAAPTGTGYLVCDGKIVYNVHQISQVEEVEAGNPTSKPEEDVRGILVSLVNLMKQCANRCNAQGLYDCTSAEMMTKTAEYHDITAKTSILKKMDLSQMSVSEKCCFYGNLQNLMTLHCYLKHIEILGSPEMTKKGTGDHWSVSGLMFDKMTTADQITWLNTFSYHVGQLGVVSLFELKYIINRSELKAPSEWGRTLEHRLTALDESDPWHQLSPSPRPQMLFLQTSCCVSSAPVQILEPSTVKTQLDTAMKSYIQTMVTVDKQQKVVHLPELLLWHRKDFMMNQLGVEYTAENEGLLKFIVSYLSNEKEKDLNEMLSFERQTKLKDSEANYELPFDVVVDPFCKEFLCVFDFTGLQHAQEILQQADDSDDDQPTPDTSWDMTYNLTPNTLKYIKENCPLVATLVSLVCSDEFDDVLDDLQERHFASSLSLSESSLRNRSPSAMSLVDLKSYRYEKLNDYQKLKHHILNYIIPLAATEDQEILKGDDPILRLLTSETVEKFKLTMLSLHESLEFNKMLTELLNDLFSLRKWTEIVKVIDCLPVTVLRHDVRLQSMHDFVLCCQINTRCSTDEMTLTKEKSEEVLSWIHKLMCSETQAREVLAVYKKLHIEHNMDLFHMCLNIQSLSENLRAALAQKSEEVKVYYRITECAKNLQFRLAMKSSEFIREEDKIAAKKRHLILNRFTEWSNVVSWTKSSPREVLGLLIKTRDFETAKAWSRLHSLPDDIHREIEQKHVVSLLNMKPAGTTEAFLILEEIKKRDISMCVDMCQHFVQTLNRAQDVVFVTSYMLNELVAELKPKRRDQLQLTHLGARMLLCLPPSMHTEYSHLTSHPPLLLEQLLMNMQPELAGKAFRTVCQEFSRIQDTSLHFTVENFNKMISTYASKALEIPLVQMSEVTAERERSMSRTSTLSSERVEDDHTLGSPQPNTANIESMHVKRRSVDLQGIPRIGSKSNTPSGSLGRRAMMQSNMENRFVMPPEPPSRENWVPDTKASVCMVCKVEMFSMFSRRHHCRRCGRVVCAACSSKTTPIKGVNSRTCDDCYRQIVKSNDTEGLTDTNPMKRSTPALSSQALSPESVMSSTIHEEQDISLSEVVSQNVVTWKLDEDDLTNQAQREDFFFEQSHQLALARWEKQKNLEKVSGLGGRLSDQAPSTSMCISILDLHSNPRECGLLILKLCDDLSKCLRPLSPGVLNPEVDYSLVMSMMKYLLFHAKMKFIKCSENSGMAQCDMYQGLVDLLGLLVSAHFPDLPSIQELTKVDSVMRLRDKLISDERLPLAMEVSTKCGLDVIGVWVAWGMTCLQCGDFRGAREKFARCLKPPKDKNTCGSLSKVVTDIVECLESMPGTGSREIQILLSNPGSMKNLISTPLSTFFEETSMESQQFKECIYYLKTYSTYLYLIDFFRRHGYLMKAVQYVLKHKCSVDVFIEGLLKPSLDAGELGKLTDQIIILDPTLERWGPYLTSTCRYLVKMKLTHVLYDFQIFMKDFFRAGMTCCTFYQQKAQSYIDLYNNRQYLFIAQQHMQAYLDPGQWGGVPYPIRAPSPSNRPSNWQAGQTPRDGVSNIQLIKTPEEVKRSMMTIALQIEVTQFLYECLTNRSGQAASVAVGYVGTSKDTQLPTLFQSSQHRTSLAIMILLSGLNLSLSFELATRIIKEFKLGAVGIYTHAAREMAKSRRYGDMREVFDCVRKSGLNDPDTMDEIVGACLLVVADSQSEAKEAENIIRLLQKDTNKINAYILCGKLRSAYLMAVKEKRVEDVKRILRAAKSMDQTGVVSICNKWLEQEGHANT